MTIQEDEFFREATIRICSNLDIEEALSKCFQLFKTIFPLNEMGLHVYDRESGVIGTIAVANDEGGVLYKTPQRIKMSPEAMSNLSGTALSDVRIVNFPKKDRITNEISRVRGKADSSLLVMRLTINGQRLGALTLRADGVNQYSEEQARLLSLLNEPFGMALSNSLRYQEVLKLQELLYDDNRYLHRELLSLSGEEVIGGEFGLKGVMEMVRQVSPLNSPVLLLGETGVGKEIVANVIHYSSPRRNGPFVKVNCGAIPESLLDSELFGHEKGAFTGAIGRKRGRFERADKGTIFLDEIGELPPSAQVKLLRVIQSKEVERVGGSQPIPLDIRIVAATNRDLIQMIQSGAFREDLWFRLNVFPILIPPLRERPADIPALVYYFVERKSREMGKREIPPLASGELEKLMGYPWPGNVRELENLVERALILNKGNHLAITPLNSNSLKQVKPPAPSEENAPLLLEQAMTGHIRRVLDMAGGKVEGKGGAAERLGLNPSTLRNRMKKLAIPYGRKKI